MFPEKIADQHGSTQDCSTMFCCMIIVVFVGPTLSQRVWMLFLSLDQLADARSMMLLDGMHAVRMPKRSWQLVLESSLTCSSVSQGGAKSRRLCYHCYLKFGDCGTSWKQRCQLSQSVHEIGARQILNSLKVIVLTQQSFCVQCSPLSQEKLPKSSQGEPVSVQASEAIGAWTVFFTENIPK